jgi:very-short-patch-repair endonuclease
MARYRRRDSRPPHPDPLPPAGGEGSLRREATLRRAASLSGERAKAPPLPAGEGRGEGRPILVTRARELRKRQTDAESLLWRNLRRRNFVGVKFRRQHPVEGYIADFYCGEARLVVELDGGGHAEDGQARYDGERTIALARAGIRVLRFWNTEVLQSLDGVLEVIFEAVRRPPSP